jgi:hypothetical protein
VYRPLISLSSIIQRDITDKLAAGCVHTGGGGKSKCHFFWKNSIHSTRLGLKKAFLLSELFAIFLETATPATKFRLAFFIGGVRAQLYLPSLCLILFVFLFSRRVLFSVRERIVHVCSLLSLRDINEFTASCSTMKTKIVGFAKAATAIQSIGCP